MTPLPPSNRVLTVKKTNKQTVFVSSFLSPTTSCIKCWTIIETFSLDFCKVKLGFVVGYSSSRAIKYLTSMEYLRILVRIYQLLLIHNEPGAGGSKTYLR